MKLSEKKLQELKEKKISIEELNEKYFYTQKDGINIGIILKLLNENICSFKEIVDKFKNIKDSDNGPSLWKLLENKELFKKLVKNNKLNQEGLKYLLNRIDKHYELWRLSEDTSENTSLLKHIVCSNAVSFKEVVDKFKSIRDDDYDSCLTYLLGNEEMFQELIQNNKLTKDDLKYLLNKIDDRYELRNLCKNTPLIRYTLNEFILTKEDINKFNEIIKSSFSDRWCKENNIHTVFEYVEYVEYRNKNNKEILKLNELNKKGYLLSTFDLTKDQKLELSEVLKDSEIAQNTLIQIVDSNLEDQYDFEKLKSLLTKEDRKSLKTKFNF